MQTLQERKPAELALVTGSSFLETYSPRELSKLFRKVNTALQAIDQGGSSLFKLKKDVGEKKVLALIKLYLIDLNDLFNLKRPLSERMIEEIADEVINEFGHLNMADIHLIFKRAKHGENGDMYETLNVPKVITWFTNYFAERCDAAGDRSRSNAKERNVDPYQRSSSKEADKAHKALIMKLKFNEKKLKE